MYWSDALQNSSILTRPRSRHPERWRIRADVLVYFTKIARHQITPAGNPKRTRFSVYQAWLVWTGKKLPFCPPGRRRRKLHGLHRRVSLPLESTRFSPETEFSCFPTFAFVAWPLEHYLFCGYIATLVYLILNTTDHCVFRLCQTTKKLLLENPTLVMPSTRGVSLNRT